MGPAPAPAPAPADDGSAHYDRALDGLDALSLLDEYDSRHGEGRSRQRSCQWKIGLARRGRGGYHLQMGGGGSLAVGALNVREGIRARALVACPRESEGGGEPELADEAEADSGEASASASAGEKPTGTGPGGDIFVLHLDGNASSEDRGEEGATACSGPQGRAKAEAPPDDEAGTTGEGLGLRQRRNRNLSVAVAVGVAAAADGGSGGGGNSGWTMEVPARDDEGEVTADDEERTLRELDPLQLFGGLPPPALRAAQAEARAALASYVEAANLANEILRLVGRHADDGADDGADEDA